jgi:hypothetical protein
MLLRGSEAISTFARNAQVVFGSVLSSKENAILSNLCVYNCYITYIILKWSSSQFAEWGPFARVIHIDYRYWPFFAL